MSEDLTIAYQLGVEDMRSKLHKQADEIERLRERLAEADECNRRVSDANEQFFKQAEMNARLLTENASLRAENVQLLLELDMQQATILVPSQKDDQRRIERLDAALKEALDEAAALRARIESAEEAYVRLDASMNRLQAAFRVNMLRAFPHMSHDEIDAEIEAAIWESGDE